MLYNAVGYLTTSSTNNVFQCFKFVEDHTKTIFGQEKEHSSDLKVSERATTPLKSDCLQLSKLSALYYRFCADVVFYFGLKRDFDKKSYAVYT